eukprot:CAMPEP_0114369382 /NCGR_PEP_ID=MMETSP0101-20121206/31631_1 /TAXON_ID=38822 ORGANISM="Pteridomonas danica, Strain PT" /NCGR_SAMPLE_ID=MMETSP0101 /ASSEMBLY_ACC=CAM_ASM_000211 /LENGTH=283 /DNA_ID=CAMNT_0001520209 /DNA_START=343 /DNA_END=1194 /DNA_ORIENTATION=-
MHEVMQQKGEILPRDKGASWSTLQEMRKRAGSAGARVFLQHSSIIRLHHQLKWYPVVLTISWGYRCSCRLNEAMSHYVNEERYLDTENSTAGLLFIFAGGFATQATLNFFIYGFTPAVRKAWLTLWHEVVVEGNMRSIARFESYAVSPPIEEDDGYDPRYEDSESDVYPYNGGWGSQNQFNAASHGQQSASASASSSLNSNSRNSGSGGIGGFSVTSFGGSSESSTAPHTSRVEQRLSASLEMGKYGGNSLRQHKDLINSHDNNSIKTSTFQDEPIVSESNHI